MYAIIEVGGKQYTVENGSVIYTEKLSAEAGETVTFDKVLMIGGEKTAVGTPTVEGATVTAEIVKQGKQKKMLIMTYKAKKHEKKKNGHRQCYTKVEIKSINA